MAAKMAVVTRSSRLRTRRIASAQLGLRRRELARYSAPPPASRPDAARVLPLTTEAPVDSEPFGKQVERRALDGLPDGAHADVEPLSCAVASPGRERLISSRAEHEDVSGGGFEQRNDPVSYGGLRGRGAEDHCRHRPQWIELVADRDDLPSVEAQVVGSSSPANDLVRSGAVLEPERDGNGIREATLPGEAGGEGEAPPSRAPRKAHEAGIGLQSRDQEV